MAAPEQVGMSATRLARIDSVIQEYIDNKWLPGYVLLIARRGKIVLYKSFGYKDIAIREVKNRGYFPHYVYASRA